jgi:hypothetical protein
MAKTRRRWQERDHPIQYKVIEIPDLHDQFTPTLNSYYADGWELVTAAIAKGGSHFLYLKRREGMGEPTEEQMR